jgi:hypothetical protein
VDLIPSSSQQLPQINQELQLEIEYCNDQHQDYEEEIEATIAEELAYLWQENKRLRLEQESIMRLRAATH